MAWAHAPCFPGRSFEAGGDSGPREMVASPLGGYRTRLIQLVTSTSLFLDKRILHSVLTGAEHHYIWGVLPRGNPPY